MASTASEGDVVVLEIIDPSAGADEVRQEEVTSISTSFAEAWNCALILRSSVVEVRADRGRLVEQSAYFRSLLCGSFSESSLEHISVQWNLEGVIYVLLFIYSSQLHITSSNFLPILEAALYFGVEGLLSECEAWFRKMTSAKGQQIPLKSVIEVWNFSIEHGIQFVPELCKGYLARNFAWVTSCSSFPDIPYDLLQSCIEDPLLTPDSERQLCEALVIWLSRNRRPLQCSSDNYEFDILKKVRICLLPLDLAAGLKQNLLQFGEGAICTIMNLMKDCSTSIIHAVACDELATFRLRVTEYSEKIVLAGCVHITVAFVALAMFPSDLDIASRKRMIHAFAEHERRNVNNDLILDKSIRTLSFSAVREVDISRCPKLHIGAIVKCFLLAFPSLSILRASHCPQIKMEDLYYLIQKIPAITDVDVTLDVSPLLLARVSVVSASTEDYHVPGTTSYAMGQEKSLLFNVARTTVEYPNVSNISKLTLEGRNDINDLALLAISALCGSLSYINIKGCTEITDTGISKLISKCLNIQALILSYTSFGRNSIATLCSEHLLPGKFNEVNERKYSNTMAFRLKRLHIDGCKGADQDYISQLMLCTYMLKILVLRETSVTDDALYSFPGSFLESLDVSETMVSMQALISVVRRNAGIRCLKATGCTNLKHVREDLALTCKNEFKDHFELSTHCMLEEMTFGWGFSLLSVDELVQLNSLRSITIGLGASPSHHVLCSLPKICPLLESVILIFQAISDCFLRSIQESLKNLKVLHLCCCLGDLTSSNFKISMPQLRILRLQWVTPWMTNSDLAILTTNCPCVVKFSLSGCKLLDSASQEILASGWPGLTFIHLEDCGKITSNGVSSLFNCKAIEDLLLRHNGKGIGRNFIHDAASKLPLLRKLTLDLCDACEGGFDSPNHAHRCFLSMVKINRCKSQRCAFDSLTTGTSTPVHKDTIVLEWTCREARTTVVKERL